LFRLNVVFIADFFIVGIRSTTGTIAGKLIEDKRCFQIAISCPNIAFTLSKVAALEDASRIAEKERETAAGEGGGVVGLVTACGERISLRVDWNQENQR
jgi:hypothetical protein